MMTHGEAYMHSMRQREALPYKRDIVRRTYNASLIISFSRLAEQTTNEGCFALYIIDN